MKKKVRGIISLEATIVVPFIFIMSMVIIILMAKEMKQNLTLFNVQKIVTSAYDFRAVPYTIDTDSTQYIYIPTISAASRNDDRYSCKIRLSGGE